MDPRSPDPGLRTTVKLPPELWALVIANHDSHDRSSLLPLQRASKQLHALVTPLVYRLVSITYSGADDFVDWATAHSGDHIRMTTFIWKPQSPYTRFPHISIPFHRLSRLHATFTSNPTLATHTSSLVLDPFHGRVRLVEGWRDIVEHGWAELRAIFPFFLNVEHISVRYKLGFRSDILFSLPTPGRLTYLQILIAENPEDVLSLFQLHPNLHSVHIPNSRSLSVSNHTSDTPIDLRRLVSLTVNLRLWTALCRGLTTSSLSALRHLSINDVPIPLPPPLTLNHLLSIQITFENPSVVAQLLRHLRNIEYISITGGTSDDVVDVNALFNIPSTTLKYVHLGLYLPHSAFHSPSPSALFDQFTELVIVDFDDLSNDDSCVTRFLRNKTTPVEVVSVSLEPFQMWWERASEDVGQVTANE